MRPSPLASLALAVSFAATTFAPALAHAQRRPPAPARPPPAARPPADPNTVEARRLFEDGAAAYAKGNYEEAIRMWEKSYDLSKRPLIFESIANAYERLGDSRKARDYLVRWREMAPRDEWDLLDERIKNLSARVKREEELESQRKAEEDKARSEQAAREQALRAQATPADTGPPLPAIVMMGVGGAAVLVGVTFDVIAGIRRPSEKSACATTKDGSTLCRSNDASAISSSNTFATVGDITWIAGAVVGSAGAVWFIWKRSPSQPTETGSRTVVTPSFGRTGGGLSLVHSF